MIVIASEMGKIKAYYYTNQEGHYIFDLTPLEAGAEILKKMKPRQIASEIN